VAAGEGISAGRGGERVGEGEGDGIEEEEEREQGDSGDGGEHLESCLESCSLGRCCKWRAGSLD
jgi:hypothetical protein